MILLMNSSAFVDHLRLDFWNLLRMLRFPTLANLIRDINRIPSLRHLIYLQVHRDKLMTFLIIRFE